MMNVIVAVSFIGVLFGPAMAATICVLLEELYLKNIKEKEENVDSKGEQII